METNPVNESFETQKKVQKILGTMSPTSNKLCPVKDVLHNVGDKWSIIIMMILCVKRTLRFNELKTQVVGISQKVLTSTLKNLEANGFVERKMYPQIPPRVEYSITQLGDGFLQQLTVMLEWACSNLGTIEEKRNTYEENQKK